MPHPLLTFSKGVQKWLKKYVQVKLGFRSHQVPHPGRGKQAARNSQEKGRGSNCSGLQGGSAGLLHRKPGSVHRLTRVGNCPAQVRGHVSQRPCLFAAGQKWQRRKEETGSLQWLFQAALRGIHPLETEYRRTYGSGRPAISLQQHERPYDHAGNRESLQTDSSKSGLAFSLFYSLSQTYLRLRTLQSQRLQPAARPETAWALSHRDYPGIRRRGGTRYAAGLGETVPLTTRVAGKALCMRGCECRPDGFRNSAKPVDSVPVYKIFF